MKTQTMIMLLLAAGTAMAQQRERNENRQPPSAAELLAKLDKDGDSKISQSEFEGPEEHFTMFDKDGDGYLSESELPSGPPQGGQQGQQGRQRGQSQRPQRGQGLSSEDLVTRLDKDSDGKISESEFDGPSGHFSKLDTDGDGYISSDEAASAPPRRGRQ